jgi:hypothetical protein
VAAGVAVAGYRLARGAGSRVGRLVRRVTFAGGRGRIQFRNLRFDWHVEVRMGQRNISNRAVNRTLKRGTIYFDPKYNNYSLFRRTRSGRYIQVAIDPLLGMVKTVNRVRRIGKRFTKTKIQ